jgi:hypothetical protein
LGRAHYGRRAAEENASHRPQCTALCDRKDDLRNLEWLIFEVRVLDDHDVARGAAQAVRMRRPCRNCGGGKTTVSGFSLSARSISRVPTVEKSSPESVLAQRHRPDALKHARKKFRSL